MQRAGLRQRGTLGRTAAVGTTPASHPADTRNGPPESGRVDKCVNRHNKHGPSTHFPSIVLNHSHSHSLSHTHSLYSLTQSLNHLHTNTGTSTPPFAIGIKKGPHRIKLGAHHQGDKLGASRDALDVCQHPLVVEPSKPIVHRPPPVQRVRKNIQRLQVAAGGGGKEGRRSDRWRYLQGGKKTARTAPG